MGDCESMMLKDMTESEIREFVRNLDRDDILYIARNYDDVVVTDGKLDRFWTDACKFTRLLDEGKTAEAYTHWKWNEEK